MEKIKIMGLGKSKYHNHYSFNKNQKILTFIRELLKAFNLDDCPSDSFGRPVDKKYGEPIYNKEEDVKKYIDRIFSFKNDDYYMEIVFGKEKVFIMIHTKEDRQNKISKTIEKLTASS